MTDAERIIKLETQMENLDKKVEDGFKVTEKRFDSMEELIKEFIDRSEEKFASKWVETGTRWAVTLVLGIVITAIVYLIIKK